MKGASAVKTDEERAITKMYHQVHCYRRSADDLTGGGLRGAHEPNSAPQHRHRSPWELRFRDLRIGGLGDAGGTDEQE